MLTTRHYSGNYEIEDIKKFVKEQGYEDTVPIEFYGTPHRIFSICIAENPAVNQKLVVMSVEKRQKTTFNTESFYFVKSNRKVLQQTWYKDKLVGSYQ